MFGLASSGRRAVLILSASEDAGLVRKWVTSEPVDEDRLPLAASFEFQRSNKTHKLENCCPVSSALGLLCVDSLATSALVQLDRHAGFLPVSAGDSRFFVYRSSNILDPLASGYELNSDNKRRIRAPIFQDDLPHILQLPDTYESFGETLCSEHGLNVIRQSKARGFSVWDFETRTESRI